MSTQFPISRIRTIMKSSADVDVVRTESLLLVARATELFAKYLASAAHKEAGYKKKLDYSDLANFVHSQPKLDFLGEIMPKKISVREYKQILAENKTNSDSDSEESDEINTLHHEKGDIQLSVRLGFRWQSSAEKYANLRHFAII